MPIALGVIRATFLIMVRIFVVDLTCILHDRNSRRIPLRLGRKQADMLARALTITYFIRAFGSRSKARDSISVSLAVRSSAEQLYSIAVQLRNGAATESFVSGTVRTGG